MANYANLKAAIQEVIKTNGNEEITGAVMQSSLLSIINSLVEGYLFAGVATPSTNAGSPDQNVFYIGGAGVYANFGTSITVPDGSICVFKYNGSWTKELCNVGSGAFNVSKANAVGGVYATYSTLSDALNAVPSSSRQGGMTIMYIDEDSQEYVQYRLRNKNWSTNVSDWQGVDDEPKKSSHNLVESGGIYSFVNEKINDYSEKNIGITAGDIVDFSQATIFSTNNRASFSLPNKVFIGASQYSSTKVNVIFPVTQNRKYVIGHSCEGYEPEFGVKFVSEMPSSISDAGFDLVNTEFDSGNNSYCVLYMWIPTGSGNSSLVTVYVTEYFNETIIEQINEIKNSIDELDEDVSQKTKMLTTYQHITDGITPNTYINPSGGQNSYTTELNRFASTGFIKLPQGVKFKVKNFTEGIASFCIYGGDKGLQRTITHSIIPDEYISFELREPEQYIRTTILADVQPDITYLDIFYDENPVEQSINFNYDQGYVNLLVMFDNLVCVGDSLTRGMVRINPSTSRIAKTTYPRALKKLCDMETVQNISESGANAMRMWNTYNGELTSKNNAIFILYLGTNDGLTDTFSQDVSSHENPSDYANTNTGCYAKWVAKAQELGYKVLLIRPYAVGGSGTLETTKSVIAQVASYFKCPYIDAPYNLSPEYFYYADYTQGANGDDVHYNDIGYVWFANQVINRVSQLGDSLKYLLDSTIE